jgi:hypothetical protein
MDQGLLWNITRTTPQFSESSPVPLQGPRKRRGTVPILRSKYDQNRALKASDWKLWVDVVAVQRAMLQVVVDLRSFVLGVRRGEGEEVKGSFPLL